MAALPGVKGRVAKQSTIQQRQEGAEKKELKASEAKFNAYVAENCETVWFERSRLDVRFAFRSDCRKPLFCLRWLLFFSALSCFPPQQERFRNDCWQRQERAEITLFFLE